jgi:hypothetical protein
MPEADRSTVEAALIAAVKSARAAGLSRLVIGRAVAWGLREASDLAGAEAFDELANGFREPISGKRRSL